MKLGRNAVRTYGLAILAASCVSFAADSAIGQSTVPNRVFAGGGGTISAGSFRVHYTLGEAVAGTVSAGTLTIKSGFQATFVNQVDAAPDDGRIFYDGYEGN